MKTCKSRRKANNAMQAKEINMVHKEELQTPYIQNTPIRDFDFP